MRFSSLITALVGLVVAGGSVYAARDYFESQKIAASTSDESALVQVVVASRDIAFGQAIEPQMLTSMAWPREAVPPGSYFDYAGLLPAEGAPPRRAKRNISQGELILVSKVSDFGEKVTIVQTLGPNSRAMAISVNAETAVGGFVTPGDTVDVLLTQGGGQNLRTVTILQNIRVIGVDQQSDEQSDAPKVSRTVTVEVSPEEGQRLALAQQAGTLSLTLRTLDAGVDAPLDSIRLSDVMQDVSPVPEDAPARRILVRRGIVETFSETTTAAMTVAESN
jgi:pilus assembly protein CpaB